MRVQTFNRERVVKPAPEVAKVMMPEDVLGVVDEDFDSLAGGKPDYRVAPGLLLHEGCSYGRLLEVVGGGED